MGQGAQYAAKRLQILNYQRFVKNQLHILMQSQTRKTHLFKL